MKEDAPDGYLVQVEAPHFVAGFTVVGSEWGVFAPIIKWAVRSMTPREFVVYCRGRGYTVRIYDDRVRSGRR